MGNDNISRRDFLQKTSLAAAGAIVGPLIDKADAAENKAIRKTRSYNPDMRYRRLGKTGQYISAVALGGHWKRVTKIVPNNFGGWADESVDYMNSPEFLKNRTDVVNRCMEVGINYIDACMRGEVIAYSKVLGKKRDKMYLGVSYFEHEARNKNYRTADKLLESLDAILGEAKLEYADLWRITCLEPGGKHTFNTSYEVVAALEKAKKQGKTRFTGISSHDRKWLKMMIEYFPQIETVLSPYTARTKKLPTDSIFDALKKHDVGFLGIKPFASNSLFKGSSAPDDPNAREDNRRARLAIRYILCNPVITAPIPGLITTQQVDNMAKAITERRTLDVTEKAELEKAMDQAWAKLPGNYQWLKNWEYV